MELKEVAQLLITAAGKVEFYWHFYVVMLIALAGWMVSATKPVTTHLKVLVTVGYIVFACMNLVGLWGSYTFAEALRRDLLAMAMLTPGELTNTRAVLSEHSFQAQRSIALIIHVLLGTLVLLAVWLGWHRGDPASKTEDA